MATRGSALARWQAEHVASLFAPWTPDLDVELVIVDTTGDRRQDVEIWQIGGKGVFVKEVQAAVLDRRADIAVHSAKDLPSREVDGLVLGCGTGARRGARRARGFDPGGDPGGRPGGHGFGSSSCATRRSAAGPHVRQPAGQHPDATRACVANTTPWSSPRSPSSDSGLADAVAELLPTDVMLPQVGQGALAIECREDDDELRGLLAGVEDGPSRRAVDAERAFLDELGGDCDLPAGALAHVDDDEPEQLEVEGLLASLDGRIVLRHRERGTDPVAAGRAVAAHLLDRAGGREVLLA